MLLNTSGGRWRREIKGRRTQFSGALAGCRRKVGHRPGEMAQTVKCLLFEHEDPRTNSQNPQEELADQCVPLIPGLSGGDR